ncbi:MAG: 2Fe-2S iron-sulfur cluster binding domain-containing protein [Betaproteobacteria bacterium]|nr:2Fe-2S iron-sulfur cluster binding domain-containing protein [Betaproteobacteria bacterium]
MDDAHDDSTRLSRREAVKTVAALFAAGVATVEASEPSRAARASGTARKPVPGGELVTVRFEVNGLQRELRVDTRTTLLDALREHLGLTGTKKGCDHGQCGACTVLAGGRRINACLSLAVMHEGNRLVTIEGLGTEEHLHALQSAFIAHDGFQCGYCTPGQICSAAGMMIEACAGVPSLVTEDLTLATMTLDDAEVRERMSGNLCRCSAYPNIVAAIREVADARGCP